MTHSPTHSPEPWTAVNHPLGVIVQDANEEPVNLLDFDGIEELIGRANLNRAVACVNACAGIPTEALKDRIVYRSSTALDSP